MTPTDDQDDPRVTADDDQEQESGKGVLKGSTTLSIEARGEAVEVAAGHLGLSSDAPTVLQSDLVRRADLASLADQTEGRKTETMNIIIEDPDSTCAQFGYDKGSLTEVQAQILFKEIVKRREIEEQQERELEKTLFGFVGRIFSWIAKAGGG